MKKLLQLLGLFIGLNAFSQVTLENFPDATTSIVQPTQFINYNNKTYCFGRNNLYQWSLFSTDGTTTGNQIVKTFVQSLGNPFPIEANIKYNDYKIEYNNKLYFSAGNSAISMNLWQSDGTTAGTNVLVPSLQQVKYFIVFNGKLYFTANNSVNGNEIWSTDGTAAGTTMLKDIYPGSTSSIDPLVDPHFTIFNGKLYFVANDGVTGWELWSTDGTSAGTSLLKNLRTIETETQPYNQGAFRIFPFYSLLPFKVFNNKMYFTAVDDQSYNLAAGFVLCETDGTAAGTKRVVVPSVAVNGVLCSPDINVFSPKGFNIINNNLVMCGSVRCPISSNVPTPGFFRIDSSNTLNFMTTIYYYKGDSGSSADTEQAAMRLFNGEYYFIGRATFSGSSAELWKLNPTTNQCTQVSNPAATTTIVFNQNTNGNFSTFLISKEWNSKLYFVKGDENYGAIFSTTGTLASTSQVTKMANNQTMSSPVAVMSTPPSELNDRGNGLYFGASFTNGTKPSMWRFYDPSLSTQQLSKNRFSLFPNPTSNTINLKFETTIENANLKITSILGQTVLEKQNLSGNDFSFDFSKLSNGIYILELSDGKSVSNSKFIKE
jgi:ELWxxDGT repeat protein